MIGKLDMQPEHLEIVREILHSHLPVEAIVWVFGSRVAGNAKTYSDLDVAIDTGQPLSLDILAALAADFDESNLPYKVDLVDWHAIDASFRQKIERQRLLLDKA